MKRSLTAGFVTALTARILVGCSSAPSDSDKKYAALVTVADTSDFGGIDRDTLAGTLSGEGPDLCKQLHSSFADAVAYAKLGYSNLRRAASTVAVRTWSAARS
ncbi:hypothetical protein [Streptomyces sp. NBC_00557]|uniref:hypothetical protein n=1 Tax=Streptomyces sp. NBC_00557 TaxID=2975776 RepID=UPI002E823F40|nr:hypothetical protein [Streptomyces sp. NBC_00557]WUC39593.1 hypothetical protein OG956_38140 [Streptomyces sp. NBC_00557]